MTWTVIGVDPAPAKPSTFWTGDGPHSVAPAELRRALEPKTASDSVLVAWDAPLSFDAEYGYSDRPIDRAVRRFIKGNEAIAPKAVAALPFSGCAHWAITCATLGWPFRGAVETAWRLSGPTAPAGPGRYVAEVHPAVALAFWWIERGPNAQMPRYKGKGSEGGLDVLVAGLADLAIPEQASESDDLLDAWVAYRLGCDFLSGNAAIVGSPTEGAYLLPSATEKHADLAAHLEAARKELRREARRGR